MQRFKSPEPTRSTFPPLMRSFTAIFIHADTDWRLLLIARSAPRPSVCGGRRRVSTVRHNLPYILALPFRGSPQIDMTMPAGTLTREAVPGNPARRHDRGVGDPQAGNAMNAKLRTDDCHRIGARRDLPRLKDVMAGAVMIARVMRTARTFISASDGDGATATATVTAITRATSWSRDRRETRRATGGGGEGLAAGVSLSQATTSSGEPRPPNPTAHPTPAGQALCPIRRYPQPSVAPLRGGVTYSPRRT